MRLKNRLFNTRLRNDPNDLQQIVSGATKDITDMTKLLASLNKYRADVMNQMNDAIKKAQSETNFQEGILGQKPIGITSVAELML